MGFLDMLFGRKKDEALQERRPVSFGEGPMRLGGQQDGYHAPNTRRGPLDENEQALERYRYMLRTAPPETIEQAHAEAFERMTPEQRSYVLQALATEIPERELTGSQGAVSDPREMARIATRAELRNPGAMERALGAHQGQPMPGGGMLGGMAGTLLMGLAAGFVGSMAASAFLDAMGDPLAGAEELVPELPGADEGYDAGFADFGGDFGEEF